MATEKSTAHPAHPSTRERRRLELYRRGGIDRVARDLYIVPSRSRRRVEYLVDLERQSCECRDHARPCGPCKHVYAAMLYQAWIRRSARVVATSGAFDAGDDR
jgi:hypothetical protein